MGMMTRFVRMMKADVHGVLDQIEDKTLTLKQSLRDMRDELDRKEARLKKMQESKSLLLRDRESLIHEITQHEKDLDVAIERDKEEIARMLIKKIKPLNDQQQRLAKGIATLDDEISRFQKIIAEQNTQYNHFKLEVRDYCHQSEQQEWQETMADALPVARPFPEPSEEEIDLELLRRKELVKNREAKK
ncbi:PspA/IM30 family protein [Thermodesulfobacteriota bacterium]